MVGVDDSDNGDGRKVGEFFPHDILINILKRLPVKSLARFNCVSKDWAKLFKTPHFIAQHLHHSARHDSSLLLERTLKHPRQHQSHPFCSYCLIGPDLKVRNSQFHDFISPAFRIAGSCNGLLCLRDADCKLSLCNPATRQIKQVPQTLIDVKNLHYIGFGFSPAVDDYKIVKISVSGIYDEEDGHVVLDNVRVSRVEVYSLTTGSWKEIVATNLQNSRPMSKSVAVDGALFWMANMSSSELEDPDVEFVVSFDIGQEVFSLLKGPRAPHSPTRPDNNKLTAYDNKLAMFRQFIMGNYESSSIELWVLNNNTHTCAGGESWIKLYNVGPFARMLYPLIMWKDEIVCMEELSGYIDDHRRVEAIITLFNPCTNEFKSLPARTDEYYYVLFNYEESLVQVANIQHEL